MSNIYRGFALQPARFAVTVNGEPLDPKNDVINHSPDGFAWGYGGSGPAQLAFAMLYHELGEVLARGYYHDFKFEVIATFDMASDWTYTGEQIRRWRGEKYDELEGRRPRVASRG